MQYFSHIGQDRWVAEVFNLKKNGYFLDFGAFDGITISNTYWLEKTLMWNGICVEPNPTFYPELCKLRTSTTVNSALWPESRQKIEFCDAHGLSSFKIYQKCDSNSDVRINATLAIITVDTINPTELLDRFNAPKLIEYLNLDVEGCEYEVLSSINLFEYKIALMTIEHNHDEEKKNKIRKYLHEYGYEVIQNRNDDYFFNRNTIKLISSDNYSDPVKTFKDIYSTYKIRE